MIEVKLSGLMVDQASNQPVVFLKELNGERVLSIWIGPVEASAIAYALERKNFVRPLTLDLMKRLLDGLNVRLVRVVVTALKNDTFFANLVLEQDGRTLSIDARPSDSLALALRMDAPIFVADEVMERYAVPMPEAEADRINELRSYLKGLNPEEFGNLPG
jgi:hypothetical protein